MEIYLQRNVHSTVKPLVQDIPNPNIFMFLVSSWSCLCSIHWSQVLSQEWRCIWSSADRRCSNIWVINFIAYYGASYIRGLTIISFFSLLLIKSVYAKYVGHVKHFRWLGPNVWWEILQIYIEYIKPIRQMSDEPWKFFAYTALSCVTFWLKLNKSNSPCLFGAVSPASSWERSCQRKSFWSPYLLTRNILQIHPGRKTITLNKHLSIQQINVTMNTS